MKKKRKLKKEAKLLLILMILILIAVLLLIAISRIVFNNSEENNLINSMKESISEKKQESNTIKVVVDNKKEENTTNENTNTNTNENNNKTNENNNKTNEVNMTNNVVNEGMVSLESKDKYYIKINNQANVVTVYTKDSKGKYTVPVKAMLCSIGTATPKSGVYKTSDMYKWRLLQGNVYGQYAVRITGHILFHSVPYSKQAKDSLEWWEYDKLGTDASLGCIRLTVEDAKWIYDNCPKGTKVEFYSSANPGPLGKPTAKKISAYSEELKNWDPTDPDTKNPWRTYVEASSPAEENTVETVTTPVEPIDTNNNENVVDTNTITDNI